MAKLKNEKIGKVDFQEYLNSYSDFSFELRVLKLLRDRGLECQHGGHYEDPVTGISREFDIRLIAEFSDHRVRLPIECKNIRENFPLLVSCVPRRDSESFNEAAIMSDHKPEGLHEMINFDPFRSRATAHTLTGENSIYKAPKPVGKSTAQVGRIQAQDNPIISNDSEIYDKWSQCLASADELIKDMYRDMPVISDKCFGAVFPFLVVPNGRLWRVLYRDDGSLYKEPEQTDRCSFFIDKEYNMKDFPGGGPAPFRISHLEIVTVAGLESFVDDYLMSHDSMLKLFGAE